MFPLLRSRRTKAKQTAGTVFQTVQHEQRAVKNRPVSPNREEGP
jgi:hypothetical protein